jgi:hypothetical protein
MERVISMVPADALSKIERAIPSLPDSVGDSARNTPGFWRIECTVTAIECTVSAVCVTAVRVTAVRHNLVQCSPLSDQRVAHVKPKQ